MSATKRETTEVTVTANNIILDIEGTTTSISFVKDVLFPYVRKHVADFVKENLESDNLKTIVEALKSQAKEDETNKVEGVISIPETSENEEMVKALVDNVLWQMDNDRKTKSLKDLQGLIYEEGYKKGDLKGHVYEDVEPCLKTWTEEGKSIYIYSSGSVQAQKLLFGHSEKGDLLTYLKGHFDTSVGMKGESQSYKKILEEISCCSSETVFLTDVPKEARAAKEAGIEALLVSRDGNAALADEDKADFQVITSFDEIKFEQNSKKRKLSSENDVTPETDNKKIESCSEPISEKPEVPKVSNEEEKMDVDEASEQKTTEGQTPEDSKSSESAPSEVVKEVASSKDEKEVVKSEVATSEDKKEEAKSEVASSEDKKEEAKSEVAISEENKEEAKSDEAVISSSDDSKPAAEESTEVSKPKETDSATDSADSQTEVDAEKVQTITETEANKDSTNPDSTENKASAVADAVTNPDTAVDSTEKNKIEGKTDSETAEKKTEPEVSSPSETKAVKVEESKEPSKETENVPQEVSKLAANEKVPKEEAVNGESEAEKDEQESKPSEEEKKEAKENKEDKKEIEENKEVVAVNGEAKTNGASHEDKIPNGNLTNGSASPSEKTNGAHNEAVENGTKAEKPVKAGKVCVSDDNIPVGPVIES